MTTARDYGEMLVHQMDGAVEGLVKTVGDMVKTWCGQDVLRSRKVVRAMPEDVGGGVGTLQECHIAAKTNYVVTSRFFQPFCWGFETMLDPSSVKVVFRACFRTFHFLSSRSPCDSCLASYIKLNNFLI